VKLSQLMMAAGLAAAALVGFGGRAAAAPIESSSAVVAVCSEGALTTVVDDSGVLQQACVASGAAVPPVPAAESLSAPPIVPTPDQTAPSHSALGESVRASTESRLPTTGVGTGGLWIAALLVGSGSAASLLARRKSS
jgi:hypothetical protein